MTSASLSPAFKSAPSGVAAPSAASAATLRSVTALRRMARRALKGAFVFFLVKGLLWLAAPLVLLLVGSYW